MLVACTVTKDANDICLRCWKDMDPAAYEQDMVASGARTRKGHDAAAKKSRGLCLKPFKTPDARFNCDRAEACGTPDRMLPRGTLMFGCRSCDFDWCEQCFAAEFGAEKASIAGWKSGADRKAFR